jgi:hypothetical protein
MPALPTSKTTTKPSTGYCRPTTTRKTNSARSFKRPLRIPATPADHHRPVPTQDAKTGKWTWALPAIDPTLPEAQVQAAREAQQRYIDTFVKKFVSDPAGTLDPLLEDKFNAYFEQKFSQIASQQQAQTFQQKLIADNPWLFETIRSRARPRSAISRRSPQTAS